MAIQQFVDAAESHRGDAKLRRAQLRVVSPAFESLAGMPEHLRTVVTGIFKEIDDRVFRPVQEATNLDDAMAQATRVFDIFASLWPAVLGALIPWMQESPERLVAMSQVATDVWTSEETRRRLGENACSWFAAAQDARVALAHAIRQDLVPVRSASEDTIGLRCIVADFALMFGLYLAHAPSPRTAPELPVTMAKLAYDAAKDAYVLATTDRFADRELVGE